MKPFVLAAAIDSGISPKSTINGAGKCRIPNPGGTPDPYEAENFEGEAAGVDSLYDATKHSINCAFLRLGQIVGIPKVVDMAHRLGITAELPATPSLPLGTGEIRPIDMASAYATFAAEGVHRVPYLVQEIKDRHGKVIFRHEDHAERAISTETAREVTDVLQGVVTGGTGTAARFKDRRPAAGKTGTTAEHGDAWFVGYTPELSTAVWMGSPIGRVEMRGVGGVARVTGGSFPARIWQAFMGAELAGRPITAFTPPAFVGKGTYLKMADDKDVARSTKRRRRATTTVPGSTEPSTPSTPSSAPETSPPATTAPPTAEAPSSGQTEGGA
jgi:penicillin-binding protein 1A